jgi:hypothetical protein
MAISGRALIALFSAASLSIRAVRKAVAVTAGCVLPGTSVSAEVLERAAVSRQRVSAAVFPSASEAG